MNEIKEKVLVTIHPKQSQTSLAEDPTVTFNFGNEVPMLQDASSRDDLVDRLSLLMTGGLADRAARADYREPIQASGPSGAMRGNESDLDRVCYSVLKLAIDSTFAVQR